jgi:hypothetical protein
MFFLQGWLSKPFPALGTNNSLGTSDAHDCCFCFFNIIIIVSGLWRILELSYSERLPTWLGVYPMIINARAFTQTSILNERPIVNIRFVRFFSEYADKHPIGFS